MRRWLAKLRDLVLDWRSAVLLTLGPVLIGTVLLELLGPLGDPLSGQERHLMTRILSREPFLPGVLTLVAVVAVQVCVCVVGISLALRMLSKPTRSPGAIAFGLISGLVVAILIPILSRWDLAVYRLSYTFFIDLYRGTGAEASFLHPRCLGLHALDWAILIPTCLGIIGIAIATVAGAAELHRLPGQPALPDTGYEKSLEAGQGRLKRLLYVLTLGLVASTVAVSLFFHLPAKLSSSPRTTIPLVLSADPGRLSSAQLKAATERVAAAAGFDQARETELAAVRQRLNDYAAELSIFWGAIFTLTLLAAGGLPLIRLRQKVRDYLAGIEGAAQAQAAEERLSKAGLLADNGRDQLKLLILLIAPLASGPIANFVQAAAGS